VDDGELRSFNDPANKAFLASIQRGEVRHILGLFILCFKKTNND